MKNLVEKIKEKTKESSDIIFRDLDVEGKKITLVFVDSMISSSYLSDFVIRNLSQILSEPLQCQEEKIKVLRKKDKNINIDNLQDCIVACRTKRIDLDKDDIFYYLYSCFTLIIQGEDVVAVETRGNIDRQTPQITTENNIKGSKDAFSENYQNNVALIRKRLKTDKLVLEENKVGVRSKTKIGIMYMSDIAKEDLVEEVRKRIKKIDIDAILNSNYIIESIEEGTETDFPTIISTERPDLVSIYILEGRVAIIVENSPFVLILPSFLEDYISNVADYFQKSRNILFTRIIRYLAFFITIVTPGLYVALITFNHQSIPADLLLSFSAQRDGVPFPAGMEALLMITAFEILREGDYRVTNMSGSTLSVVGALILGEAAVSAGIVSSILIIVVAISALSGLVFAEVNVTNAVRNWRVLFLLYGSIGGILGIAVVSLLFMTKLCSITSFGKPYTYPIAPFNITKIENDFIKRKTINQMRNRYKTLTDNLTSRR